MTDRAQTEPVNFAEAAEWIASQSSGVSIPYIRARFALSTKEACEAIAAARRTSQEKGGTHA